LLSYEVGVKINLPSAVLLVVLVAAMFFAGRYLANRSQGGAARSVSIGGDAKGQLAPGFELKDLAGKNVQLSDYHGKVVLLNFWATWCPPCKEEMPWFVDLQRRYEAQGLQVIGVAMDDSDQKTIEAFTKRLGVNYPVLLGKESTARAYGDVQFLPDTFYIGRDGKIVSHVQGLINRKEIEEEVKNALAGSSTAVQSGVLRPAATGAR
jgi:cytochrome c biogenesis protein CcmG/thiol:disulfide interchange protein DsbE